MSKSGEREYWERDGKRRFVGGLERVCAYVRGDGKKKVVCDFSFCACSAGSKRDSSLVSLI